MITIYWLREKLDNFLLEDDLWELVMNNKRFIYIVNLGLLFLLLTQLGLTTQLINKLLMNKVYQANLGYLNQSLQETRRTFVVVSGFKGLISIIEGSGIIGIELGDIIEPLDDLIDLTWQLTIASLVSLNIQQLLLEFVYATRNTVFKQLLSGGLSSLFIPWLLIKTKHRQRWLLVFLNLAKLVVIIAVFVWIMLPVLVYSSANVADWVTAERLDQATAQIDNKAAQIKRKLNQLRQEVEKIKGLDIIKGNLDRKLKGSFAELFKLSPTLLESSMQYLLQMISCFILEVFVFPVIVLGIEYCLVKVVFGQLKVVRQQISYGEGRQQQM